MAFVTSSLEPLIAACVDELTIGHPDCGHIQVDSQVFR